MPNGPAQPVPPPSNQVVVDPNADEPLWRRMWDRQIANTVSDYRNYYSWSNAGCLAAGFGVGAIVANTNMDMEFQAWYQNHVRSSGADNFANAVRPLGEGQYTIPVVATLALLNDTGWLDDKPVLNVIGDWGDRVTRAYQWRRRPCWSCKR